MCRFNAILKKKSFRSHTKWFFFNNDSLYSPNQIYSSVSEIYNHSNIHQPQLVFSLFHSPIFGIFCLISFSLVVVASDIICSHTNHLQQHVIMICVFLWNGLFRKFKWDFLKQFSILKAYISQCSMKFCSKAFSQQSLKYMVSPRKSNDYVVEFYDSGQPPQLLP